MLGDDDYKTRQAAYKSLVHLNNNYDVRPILELGRLNDNLEITRRCELILKEYRNINVENIPPLWAFGKDGHSSDKDWEEMREESRDWQSWQYPDLQAYSFQYINVLFDRGLSRKQIMTIIKQACEEQKNIQCGRNNLFPADFFRWQND